MKDMILETERLIITEFTPDMAQVVQENSVDDDNKRFVPDEVWETADEAEETLRFLISQYGSFDGPLVYPVIVKTANANVGYVQLCPIGDGKWEIGYHIAKKYTGSGYATEAVRAFLPFMARRLNIGEIYGICLAENKASLAVMKKCGFKNVFGGIGLYQGKEREIVKTVWKYKELSAELAKKEREAATKYIEKVSKKLVIYIHGKGGSAAEAAHYVPLFPNCRVIGFDYKSETPWTAKTEFAEYFDAVSQGCDAVFLIANSIGAYFSLCSLGGKEIEKAFFISPVVNMEKLIADMMLWANVSEQELKERQKIPTSFGETLSYEYLEWVRNNPVSWDTPTAILHGGGDNLQSLETINAFAEKCGAAVTVMENGEHWFHTEEQMQFLDKWLKEQQEII